MHLDFCFILAVAALCFAGVWLVASLVRPADDPPPRRRKPLHRRLLAAILDRRPPQEPHP